MGLSGGSSTQTSTTKPVYAAQIEGAANTVGNVYNQSAPKIQQYADQLGSLIPSLMDRFTQGNPAVNAAQSYVTDTLGQANGQNPFLEQIIGQTNNNVRNKMASSLGTRGLTGGTVMQDIISRNLAENESGLRYNDYNQQQQRKAQAAGMAPGLSAAESVSVAPLLGITDSAANLPMNAAAKYAAATGGLLGPYTTETTKTKQNNGLGGFFGALLSGFA